MMTEPHCQICARPIKANTGIIAHHGYRRPYAYVQTASCFGARHRPYEAAHDALDAYIPMIVDWLSREQAAHAAILASPPDELTYTPPGNFGYNKPVAVPRPADFDPAARRHYIGHSYAYLYAERVREHADAIRGMTGELVELRARRAAWVDPSPPVLDDEPMYDEPLAADPPEFDR